MTCFRRRGHPPGVEAEIHVTRLPPAQHLWAVFVYRRKSPAMREAFASRWSFASRWRVRAASGSLTPPRPGSVGRVVVAQGRRRSPHRRRATSEPSSKLMPAQIPGAGVRYLL